MWPGRRSLIKQLVGSIMDLWQSTIGWKESINFSIDVAMWLDLNFDVGVKNVTLRETKQNAESLFLWLIRWFTPRCEYDSMFVQDDVVFKCGDLFLFFFFPFLKKEKKKKEKWCSFWTAACTTITTSHYRPLSLALDHVVYLNKQEVRKLRKSCFGLCCWWGT